MLIITKAMLSKIIIIKIIIKIIRHMAAIK